MPESFTKNDRMLGTAGTDGDGKKGFYPSVAMSGDYPAGAVAVGASASVAATATGGTLGAGGTGRTTHICGLIITGSGATAASVITATVTNGIFGTLNFKVPIPAGATVGITPLVVNFNPPIPAGSANQGLGISIPSFGVGNTDAAFVAWGYHV